MNHGTVILSAHRLRVIEQENFEARGTFIVTAMRTTVIPAWRVERELRASQMGRQNVEEFRNRKRG
jgi:hypothetical protein